MKLLILILSLLTSSARAVAPTAAIHFYSNGAAYVGGSSYDCTANGTPPFTTKGGFSCFGPGDVTNNFSGSSALNTLLGTIAGSYQIEMHFYNESASGTEMFWGFDSNSGNCGGNNAFYMSVTGITYWQDTGKTITCVGGQKSSTGQNQWNSFIVTSDGTTVWTYYNNTKVDTQTVGSYGGTVTASKFGYYNGTAGAHTYLRDIVIYNGNNCAGTGTCADYVSATPTLTPTPTISATSTVTPSATRTRTPLVTYTPAPQNGYSPKPMMGFNCMTITTAAADTLIDGMVSSGAITAGYHWIHFDAGDFQSSRDGSNNLVPRTGFDIAAVCSYAHARGVSVSAYLDEGTLSCAAPDGSQTVGSWQFECQDATQLAGYGVDGIVVDGCNLPGDVNFSFTNQMALFSYCIAHSGRPMTFSSWGPISFSSMSSLGANAWMIGNGPTSFSDADVLLNSAVLNRGLAGPTKGWNLPEWLWDTNGWATQTNAERYWQLQGWAFENSPLIFSQTNPGVSTAPSITYILNSYLIADNQDPLGIPGATDTSNGSTYVRALQKPVATPGVLHEFYSNGTLTTQSISFNLAGVTWAAGVARIFDITNQVDLGSFSSTWSSTLPSHSAQIISMDFNTPVPTATRTPIPDLQDVAPLVNRRRR